MSSAVTIAPALAAGKAGLPDPEVTSVELDQGVLLSHLTIDFSNGASWQFDVPRQAKKPAQAVARALDGTVD